MMPATSLSRGPQWRQLLLLAVVLSVAWPEPSLPVAQASRDLQSSTPSPSPPTKRDAADLCDVSDLPPGVNASAFTTQCAANCLVYEAGGARARRRCVCCRAGHQASRASNATCAACPVGSFKPEPGLSQRCSPCSSMGMTATSSGSTACNACKPGHAGPLPCTACPADTWSPGGLVAANINWCEQLHTS
ncbi:hypothetical protein OEZ85_003327 [Tetradesmus obliquus]|uniref:Tyrosine-protein kinase ephrin type A/B receptor-like domain-containing protein n=1 Tax=Tetradesmus obliquus TaxID=3088 RepID=A0ABY8UDT7_TETOB|nr:hypothetical protein OEZ85_003327 [Tetradesmus obliquus]